MLLIIFLKWFCQMLFGSQIFFLLSLENSEKYNLDRKWMKYEWNSSTVKECEGRVFVVACVQGWQVCDCSTHGHNSHVIVWIRSSTFLSYKQFVLLSGVTIPVRNLWEEREEWIDCWLLAWGQRQVNKAPLFFKKRGRVNYRTIDLWVGHLKKFLSTLKKWG